jgi:hypothetical protein
MINSDDIERNGLTWSMVDELRPTRIPSIINTDTSDGPGIHWCVTFITPDGKGYLYDPLGKANDRQTTLHGAADPYIARAFKGRPIHIYGPATQLQSNALCGWHSIFIGRTLIDYLERFPRATSTEIDKVIETQFGKHADQKNVDILYHAFGGSLMRSK